MLGVVACVYNNSAGKMDTGRCLWSMDNQPKVIDDHQAKRQGGRCSFEDDIQSCPLVST